MSLEDGEFGYHALERAALGFVLEDESWPVFLAWAKQNMITDAGKAWAAAADLREARKLWAAHSPEPLIRAIGEEL